MSKFTDLYNEMVNLVPKAEAAFREVEPIVAGIVTAVDPAAGEVVAVADKVVAAIPEVTSAITIAENLVSGLKAVARGETPAEWKAFIAEKNIDDAAILALQVGGN